MWPQLEPISRANLDYEASKRQSKTLKRSQTTASNDWACFGEGAFKQKGVRPFCCFSTKWLIYLVQNGLYDGFNIPLIYIQFIPKF